MQNIVLEPRLKKIREQWPDTALMQLPGVPDDKTGDEIFDLVIQADPSAPKQMVSWILSAWQANGLHYDGIKEGETSKISKAIRDFYEIRDAIPDHEKSMMTHTSIQSLENTTHKVPLADIISHENKAKMSRETFRHTISSQTTLEMPLTTFAWDVIIAGTSWQIEDVQKFQAVGPVIVINTNDRKICAFINLDCIEMPDGEGLSLLDETAQKLDFASLPQQSQENILDIISDQLSEYHGVTISDNVRMDIQRKLLAPTELVREQPPARHIPERPEIKDEDLRHIVRRLNALLGPNTHVSLRPGDFIDIIPRTKVSQVLAMAGHFDQDDYTILADRLFIDINTIRKASLSEMKEYAPFFMNRTASDNTLKVILERTGRGEVSLSDACSIIRNGLENYAPRHVIYRHLGTLAKGHVDKVHDTEDNDWRVCSVMASIMKEQFTLAEIVPECVEHPEDCKAVAKLIIDKSMIANEPGELDELPLTTEDVIQISKPHAKRLHEIYPNSPLKDVEILAALEMVMEMQVQIKRNKDINKIIGLDTTLPSSRQQDIIRITKELTQRSGLHLSISNAIQRAIIPKAYLLGVLDITPKKPDDRYVKEFFDSLTLQGGSFIFNTSRMPSCKNMMTENLFTVMRGCGQEDVSLKIMEALESSLIPLPGMRSQRNYSKNEPQWHNIVKTVTRIIEIGGQDFADQTVMALSAAKEDWEALEATRDNLKKTKEFGPSIPEQEYA